MLRDSMRYGAALSAVVFLLASSTDAATPANGTLKPDQRTLTYTFPFSVAANISGASEDTYTCNTGPSDPCDIFELTLDLPADFKAAHPNDFLRIQAGVTSEASDIDLQLADENGDLLVSYRDQFSVGRRSLLDVLDAQNTRFNVQVRAETARFSEVFAGYQVLAATNNLLDAFNLTAPESRRVYAREDVGYGPPAPAELQRRRYPQ